MPRSDGFLVTVSPPTLDRTNFHALDRALPAQHAPFSREWLVAQLGLGLEIRMLRPPGAGFVAFQPGRLCWRPVLGVARAVMVHDMRVDGPADTAEATRPLWAAVEAFARYYGYSAIIALTGPAQGQGAIAPALMPRRDWITFDDGLDGTRLLGKVLSGPVAVPRLPEDWAARGRRFGPGLVIQTTGESAPLAARATRLCQRAGAHGIAARIDLLTDAEAVRDRAVSLVPLFSVLLDGRRIGGPEIADADILRRAGARMPA